MNTRQQFARDIIVPLGNSVVAGINYLSQDYNRIMKLYEDSLNKVRSRSRRSPGSKSARSTTARIVSRVRNDVDSPGKASRASRANTLTSPKSSVAVSDKRLNRAMIKRSERSRGSAKQPKDRKSNAESVSKRSRLSAQQSPKIAGVDESAQDRPVMRECFVRLSPLPASLLAQALQPSQVIAEPTVAQRSDEVVVSSTDESFQTASESIMEAVMQALSDSCKASAEPNESPASTRTSLRRTLPRDSKAKTTLSSVRAVVPQDAAPSDEDELTSAIRCYMANPHASSEDHALVCVSNIAEKRGGRKNVSAPVGGGRVQPKDRRGRSRTPQSVRRALSKWDMLCSNRDTSSTLNSLNLSPSQSRRLNQVGRKILKSIATQEGNVELGEAISEACGASEQRPGCGKALSLVREHLAALLDELCLLRPVGSDQGMKENLKPTQKQKSGTRAVDHGRVARDLDAVAKLHEDALDAMSICSTVDLSQCPSGFLDVERNVCPLSTPRTGQKLDLQSLKKTPLSKHSKFLIVDDAPTPPRRTGVPKSLDDYGLDDLNSTDSTDDEDCPRRSRPAWALQPALNDLVLKMAPYSAVFGRFPVIDLVEIFGEEEGASTRCRTSSAHWHSLHRTVMDEHSLD